MVEIGGGEDLLGGLEHAQGHRGVALLRDQFGGVVRGQLRNKEKIGGGDGIAQQLDAFADERRNGRDFLRRRMKGRLLEERLKAAAQLVDGQSADVLGIEPDGFFIERELFIEVDDGVGAIDAFEREKIGELVEGKELAIVLGRPA